MVESLRNGGCVEAATSSRTAASRLNVQVQVPVGRAGPERRPHRRQRGPRQQTQEWQGAGGGENLEGIGGRERRDQGVERVGVVPARERRASCLDAHRRHRVAQRVRQRSTDRRRAVAGDPHTDRPPPANGRIHVLQPLDPRVLRDRPSDRLGGFEDAAQRVHDFVGRLNRRRSPTRQVRRAPFRHEAEVAYGKEVRPQRLAHSRQDRAMVGVFGQVAHLPRIGLAVEELLHGFARGRVGRRPAQKFPPTPLSFLAGTPHGGQYAMRRAGIHLTGRLADGTT